MAQTKPQSNAQVSFSSIPLITSMQLSPSSLSFCSRVPKCVQGCVSGGFDTMLVCVGFLYYWCHWVWAMSLYFFILKHWARVEARWGEALLLVFFFDEAEIFIEGARLNWVNE